MKNHSYFYCPIVRKNCNLDCECVDCIHWKKFILIKWLMNQTEEEREKNDVLIKYLMNQTETKKEK